MKRSTSSSNLSGTGPASIRRVRQICRGLSRPAIDDFIEFFGDWPGQHSMSSLNSSGIGPASIQWVRRILRGLAWPAFDEFVEFFGDWPGQHSTSSSNSSGTGPASIRRVHRIHHGLAWLGGTAVVFHHFGTNRLRTCGKAGSAIPVSWSACVESRK